MEVHEKCGTIARRSAGFLVSSFVAVSCYLFIALSVSFCAGLLICVHVQCVYGKCLFFFFENTQFFVGGPVAPSALGPGFPWDCRSWSCPPKKMSQSRHSSVIFFIDLVNTGVLSLDGWANEHVEKTSFILPGFFRTSPHVIAPEGGGLGCHLLVFRRSGWVGGGTVVGGGWGPQRRQDRTYRERIRRLEGRLEQLSAFAVRLARSKACAAVARPAWCAGGRGSRCLPRVSLEG